jgi:hypothetical protein
MVADRDGGRVCAFAKRLLQQTLHAPAAPHAAAALFLLSHVAQVNSAPEETNGFSNSLYTHGEQPVSVS